MRDLRFAGDDPLDASKMLKLRFAVSKGAAHRQASREAAIRADEGIFLLIAVLLFRYDILAHLLRLSGRVSVLHHGLSLVDVATRVHDPLELARARRFVVG